MRIDAELGHVGWRLHWWGHGLRPRAVWADDEQMQWAEHFDPPLLVASTYVQPNVRGAKRIEILQAVKLIIVDRIDETDPAVDQLLAELIA